MVKLVKCRPHLSQSVVEFLLCQLHTAQDAARILMCHSLAAIAMQLPVLGEGMLGDLMDLYKVIGRSATDKQQELLVRRKNGNGATRFQSTKPLVLIYSNPGPCSKQIFNNITDTIHN